MSRNTWNFSYQKQEQQVVEKEEEDNRYPRSHVHNQQNQNLVDPMSNKCEVAELTWENGQLAMHRLGINLSNEQTKQIWGKTGDTLESIVHQATFQKQNHSNIIGSSDGQNQANINMDKNASYGCQQTRGVLKRMRSSDSDPQLYVGGRSLELMSARASANDNNITMVTWPCNEDSACHGGSENKEEERETKSSNLSKRSRRAAVHNQSERRRRDRINEKMKALQKLVPNASKTDKASMLEEVIKYLKQLQAQIELISNARNMEQQMMMMSLGMQSPHIQMALLARMGMCSTTTTAGMLTANLARAAPYLSPLIYPTSSLCPPFMSPAFAMPSSIPTPSQPNGDAMISPTITKSAASPNIATTTSFPFNNHPYNAFLPQSMKMEFNNEMAAQYLQQGNQENVNIQGKKE